MNVCNAFQIRSKAGILSAKNSRAKRARLAAITGQPASTCSPGGSGKWLKRASRPSTATVAYKFRPAANPMAASSAKSSLDGICRMFGTMEFRDRLHSRCILKSKFCNSDCRFKILDFRIPPCLQNRKGRSSGAALKSFSQLRLQRRLDLEAPSFQQRLRNVLGVLVAARPLAQPRRPQILVGGELILAHNLLKFRDGRGYRPDRFGLAPVRISASLGHEKCLSTSGG